MENRHGLEVDTTAVVASATAERVSAIAQETARFAPARPEYLFRACERRYGEVSMAEIIDERIQLLSVNTPKEGRDMKRGLLVTAIVVLALPSTMFASQCVRCMSKWFIFEGVVWDCCVDSSNPQVPNNCVSQGDAGWDVGMRVYGCIFVEDNCTGQPCNADEESGGVPMPLLLAFSGRAPYLTSPQDGVILDTGRRRELVRTAWPTDGGAGWLVILREASGAGMGTRQLFIDTMRHASDNGASNVYELLATLDHNRDGVVSAADPDWGRLRVWIDRNRNAKIDSGELVSLTQAGVGSISTRSIADGRLDQHGNKTERRGVAVMSTGRTISTFAVSPAVIVMSGVQGGWYGRACTAQ